MENLVKKECSNILATSMAQSNIELYFHLHPLKVVSATFFLVYFLNLKNNTCETRKMFIQMS